MAKKKLSKKAIRRKRRRRLLVFEIFILVILMGFLFLFSKWDLIDEDNTIINVERNDLAEDTEEVLKGYRTIALFGVDNRKMGNYDQGNSDTLILVSINNETKEIRMVSVYRDSYLNVYDNVYNKCNSAYANRGAQGALEMVNKNLDLDVSEYVAVDFQALVDAVDAVGGLEIEITKREASEMNKFIDENARWVKKQSSPVSAGTHVLDGVQSLVYARIRHDSNDFRRTQRQRLVISKLMEKAKSASLSELNKLINAIFPQIKTSFSLAEVLKLAGGLKDYHLGETGGFPRDLSTKNLGSKGSCVIPCTLMTNVSYVHEFLYNEVDYVPTNTVSQISAKIQADTGYSEKNAVDYGFSLPDGVDPEAANEEAAD